MFKKLMLFFTIASTIAVLAACQSDDPSADLIAQAPTAEEGYLAKDAQDGMILHAWNWSMETIESHLEAIAIAGYSTIQISPMQPQKDYAGIASWGANWWKLYQPLGFEIATEDHSLGTLSDLERLSSAADAYGIRIIVDVIANHLAENSDETLHADVEAYEPEIYNQSLVHSGYGYTNDQSIESVTRGSLGGLPDLKTGHETVQERTLHLLKAYVDAGVDGFRFDAAKHIETPEDGEYASDFWPTVIEGVEAYAADDLFIYGEILNTAGKNRAYSDYAPYMGVTANTVSDAMRGAVYRRIVSNLESIDYLEDVPAEKTVLWAESHDDYAAGHTDGMDQTLIDKTYAIQASRKAVTSLYFARPQAGGLMGDAGSDAWKSLEISEANRFNNFFVGADEAISTQDGYFVNERFTGDKEGVMVVNVNGEDSLSGVDVSHLSDGDYDDQISGNRFTVEDGALFGDLDESGIAAIYNNPYEPKPAIRVSDTGEYGSFPATKIVTISTHNATDAFYSVNGEDQVAFSQNESVELSHPDDRATITLTIEAQFGDYTVEEQYTYEKNSTIAEAVTVNNIDASALTGNTVGAWAWPQGEEGQWIEGTLEDDSFTFDLPDNHDWFLLVTFEEDVNEFTWDQKVEQTSDIEVPADGIYDGSQMNWQ